VDLDRVVVSQGAQQQIAVGRVPDGRGGDGDDSRGVTIVTDPPEESASGGQSGLDRRSGQAPGRPAPEPRPHPLLSEDPISHTPGDAGQKEAGRVGPEIQEGDQLRHWLRVSGRGPDPVKLRDGDGGFPGETLVIPSNTIFAAW
jgi:hypothetical protein